jgi:predicted DCC family thiol-disulfide oxidoreductase YuxK
MEKRVFIFDGDCAFCSSAARVMRKMTREVTPIRPYQKLDLPALGLSSELTSKAVYYVRDGKYLVAAQAIAQLLIDSKTVFSIFGLILKLPVIRSLAKNVYYWIAKNRHRLPGGKPECKMD